MKTFSKFMEIRSYTLNDAWDDFTNAVEEAGELAETPSLKNYIYWVMDRIEADGTTDSQVMELLKKANQRVRQQVTILQSKLKMPNNSSINPNWN